MVQHDFVDHARFRPAHRGTVAGAIILALLFAGCDIAGGAAPATPGGLPPAGVTAPPSAAPADTAAPSAPPAGATAPPAPPSTGTATPPLPPTRTATLPTATAVPPSAPPAARTLTGHVLDSYTGRPVSGAQVTAPGAAANSGASGEYDLGVLPPGTAIHVVAPGYAPATADSGAGLTLEVPLRPTTLTGQVTDAATGKPLQGVLVRIDLPQPTAPSVTATLTVTPNGYLPPIYAAAGLSLLAAEPPVSAALSATRTLTNATPLPPVVLPPSAPVMPTPFADDKVILAVTDANGHYRMANVPTNPTLTFKMPGYKLTKVTVGRAAMQDQALQPFVAKALYMTASAAAYPPLYKPIMDLADKSEINTIVLNIQDDNSRLVYDTKVQMAISSGAVNKVLPNIKDVIAEFHKHNLYVIGRVLTFQQPAVADANPNLAVRSKATGKPWRGGQFGQQRWLDPTNPAARQYPLALAREAVGLGFDEIQFDYIRFPSDPGPGETRADMSFSQPADYLSMPIYIQQFESEAHNMLNQTDAFMSVDVFGYVVWPDLDGVPQDAGLGQVFEQMIGYTDYICPMIYPSHFTSNEGGFADPNAHPYEIIKLAGTYTTQRIAGQRAKYRPWLQGFDWNHVPYNGRLYRLQKQAAAETGAAGYMFWDPSNIYSADGFDPK